MNQKGFTLIELMIVIAIIAIIAAIAIPNLLEARKGANESAAISALRTLVTAQSMFRDMDKDGDGAANFAAELTHLNSTTNGRLIDDYLAGGTKQGYEFDMGADSDRYSWTATAQPISDKTGTRNFYVDESGVIRFNTLGAAGAVPTKDSDAIGG